MSSTLKSIKETLTEELERDRTLPLETAYEVHAFAIYDVFTADGPVTRQLGRARAAQFAQMGYDLKRPSLMAPPGKESDNAKTASLHPLAYFAFYTWPDGDHDELQPLFDAYVQAGIIKINEPFKHKTLSGAVVSGNSVLEFALIQGKLELVTACFRNGTNLDVVPPVFSHSGFAPTDLLDWTEHLHGAGSEMHRHVAAELMAFRVDQAAQSSASMPSVDRARRRSI